VIPIDGAGFPENKIIARVLPRTTLVIPHDGADFLENKTLRAVPRKISTILREGVNFR